MNWTQQPVKRQIIKSKSEATGCIFINISHLLLSSWTWSLAQYQPATCPEGGCQAGWNSECCCHGYSATPAEWAPCFSGSFSPPSGGCSCSRQHLQNQGKERNDWKRRVCTTFPPSSQHLTAESYNFNKNWCLFFIFQFDHEVSSAFHFCCKVRYSILVTPHKI